MQYRFLSATTPLALLAIAGFASPSTVQGQAASARRPISAATEMGHLSADRAADAAIVKRTFAAWTKSPR